MSGPQLRQMIGQARQSAVSAVMPYWLPLWNNSLFVAERRAHPLPPGFMTRIFPFLAGGLTLVPILAWVLDTRLVSAVVLGMCIAAAALPALAAPFLGAGMMPSARDQSTFTSLSPEDAARGSALVTLWRLRWLIVAGLALTPALVVSLLRLDIATFTAYHESVLALGSAAPPDEVRLLLPGGGIPYFRLLIRDLSAGVLPWAVLPAAATLGLAGALLLDDVTFGQLAGLIASTALLLVAAGVWAWLSLTPLLGGFLEIARLILLAALLAGLAMLAIWFSERNARLLLST